MSIQLSVLVPGIRSHRWRELYDSIGTSFSGPWEIIIIGPFEPSDDLMAEGNVKYIQDFGSPIRCQQIGLIHAEGDYITWAADDGAYFPGSLDVSFAILGLVDSTSNHKYIHEPQTPSDRVNKDIPFHHNLIMGKYYEGYTGEVDQTYGALRHMANNWYYDLQNHDVNKGLTNMPSPAWMLNVGIVSRQLLLDVGGWDCQFEVCPFSYNDLAVRLQKHGINFILQDEMMYHCGHMPVRSGDHGPIHDAQTTHDAPLFAQIYSDPNQASRIFIDLNNWENSTDHWARRFGADKDKVAKSYTELKYDETQYTW